MVESERLNYIRNNQKKLRVDKYCSLQNSLDAGTSQGLNKGKRVIFPSTYVGNPRYMNQLYFGGIAICSHVGFPNHFITLTCNPNWPKIHKLLAPLNLKPANRPDIISRVFKLKYEEMLSDLTKNHLLKKTVASAWRIFGFPIHARKPAIERLYIHLPGQHSVLYEDHGDIDDVLSKPSISDSKILA
ncbi:hypothetical protein JHK86_019092 [Glycine max]|nr:hypothetical protein JHK86_019092 [Glycine max]